MKQTTADYNYIIPQKIVELLDERGLKHGAFARQAGYRAQEFSDMINGRKIIKVIDIVKICNVLGVEANDLFDHASKSA